MSVSCRLVFPSVAAGLLIASSVAAAAATSEGGAKGTGWTERGPAPTLFGQSEGVDTGIVDGFDDNPVTGAVHGVAPHSSNPDILYIAAVNGGIWMTSDATATIPSWTRMIDGAFTLSGSDIIFDPADGTHQTLLAGFGRFSSFGRSGGARGGLYRTTDGGTSWTELAPTTIRGRNVAKIAVNGSTIMVGVDIADSFTCSNIGVFRSTDGGATFSRVTNGLAGGAVAALEQDPSNPAIVYASVYTFDDACDTGSGIYRSSDSGFSWSKVSDATVDAVIPANVSTGTLFEISVGGSGNVFVAITPNTTGVLGGVFRSPDGQAPWTAMDLPGTDENGFVGIHPGAQGGLHMSLVADPDNSNVVYIGGDRQPLSDQDSGSFPNSIGAENFSGRLFRGDASQPSGSQWTPLTHSGTSNNSSPHADSRDMAFDANGNIIQGDDGGVFRRTAPTTTTGDWFSVNGDLQITEQHSMAHDLNSNIIISGNQDNGSSRQITFNDTLWGNFGGGDGGDVVIDVLALAGTDESIRYQSSQNLGGPRRLVYNQNNEFQGSTTLSLTVTSGAALVAQFTTPLATNQVAGSRLIIGAENSVYESMDLGDTIVELSPSGIEATSGGANAIAYGADGNPDLLYVAGCIELCGDDSDGDDGMFVRTTSGGSLSRVYAHSSGGAMLGVVVDNTDPSQAFAIESDMVLHTTDTGSNWSSVNGDIGNFDTGRFRSLLFIPDTVDDALLLGTDRGVYIARASSGFSTWTELGTGFPNSPVFDLRYDPDNDTAIAGTLGRGSLSLSPVLGIAVNSPPVAEDDTFATSEDALLSANVITNTNPNGADSDPDGDELSVTANTSPSSQGITVTVAPDGSFGYDPAGSFDSLNEGETGTSDSFGYTLSDGVLTDLATVTINITGVNDPPVANDFSIAGVMEDGTAVSMNADASDPDAEDDFSTLGYALTTDNVPAGATIAESSGEISFDPGTAFQELAQDQTTSVSVPYSVTDMRSAMDSGTITVELTGVNDAPTASDDSATTEINQSVLIAVLDNDDDVDDGIDAGTLTIETAASSGTATAQGDGRIDYTPNTDFSGDDSFQYSVRDDHGAVSNTATVNVTVLDQTFAACAPLGNRAVVDLLLEIDTSSRFTGTITDYSVSGLPESGSLAFDTNTGIISGTPVSDDLAGSPYTLTVTANDGAGGQTLEFRLTIDAMPEVSFYSSFESFCILPSP